MSLPESDWVIDQLKPNGQIEKTVRLGEGINSIGRANSCTVIINDNSVSRLHAQLEVSKKDLTIKDSGSKNGIRVNGLDRTDPVRLSDGDSIYIGEILLRLRNRPRSDSTGPILVPPTLDQVKGKTHPADLDVSPDPEGGTIQGVGDEAKIYFQKTEAEFHAIIQTCSIVSDGAIDPSSRKRCLDHLRLAFDADEAHWYPPSGDRDASIGVAKSGAKPKLRVFPFLFKLFQEYNTATALPGRTLAKHQRDFADFNLLIAPIRVPGAGTEASPLVLLARDANCNEFPPTDRTLLDMICKIWSRTQARVAAVQNLAADNERLMDKAGVPSLIGASTAMLQLRDKARRIAASNGTVYVYGENGSGKEVVSHFLHENSPRREKPFIKVNIAAIPENMIESELFGHVRGAFTGAVKARKGKFEAANGGTILLDEIGDLPYGVQAKLLRTIEAGEVQPLGANEVSRVDTRIIAATNRDLREMVGKRLFREDLYHRLDQLRIRIPPLREHLEDIEELASTFLKNICAADGLADLAFSPDAFIALREHAWPGNVRELYAVVRRCAFDAAPPAITPEVVREALRQ